ncbi:hypothetical protein CC85DRAFT_54916 [Cutaneotrichosporon oleaginosum]|uniref:Uncharacterized protein n=1 Tax=Cutaneotrichosporon oleaginosum TaxID=879819 RepID=A0A0J0XYK4_9TREE|nr:uncharacterized protein CC85DRAFT_54916 [Cutaneotrichosporon oleaginosum]KLT46116.1 hypothetical protein CC85DRAFT_54916 [Cutaneotrichosporon oleaginosum]TXT10128.1 hypothetical protein COLE_04062 [Cutaneotrichosporon oleaginosum]
MSCYQPRHIRKVRSCGSLRPPADARPLQRSRSKGTPPHIRRRRSGRVARPLCAPISANINHEPARAHSSTSVSICAPSLIIRSRHHPAWPAGCSPMLLAHTRRMPYMTCSGPSTPQILLPLLIHKGRRMPHADSQLRHHITRIRGGRDVTRHDIPKMFSASLTRLSR